MTCSPGCRSAGAHTLQQSISRQRQLLQQPGAAGPEAAASTDQLLAALKRELILLLEPYQPQGLVCETLVSEYTNVYGRSFPCEAWRRLTGAAIRPRDLLDMCAADVLLQLLRLLRA